MSYEGDEGGEKKNPAFNFAVAKLEDITIINRNISNLTLRDDLTEEQKQQKKVEFVKYLFLCTLPLTPDGFSTEFQEKVLSLVPFGMSRLVVQGGVQKHIKRQVYSEELNVELDNCIMVINLALQKKGYYMPSADESSLF